MKTSYVFRAGLAFFIIVVALAACKKEGLGGKGEIKGSAMNSGKVVKSTVFYIKYGATDSPGTDVAQYDASAPADGDGKFNFKELNAGDYYIYAVGDEGGISMTGGAHVELTKDEIKDNVIIEVQH